MTVSLALRGKPGISQATRQKVRAKATELGYYSDPDLVHLSALMRRGRPPGFHSAIAFLNVFPDPKRTQSEAYLNGLYLGAKNRAESLGYRLEEFWTGAPGMTSRRLTAILLARGIKGVLLPVHPDDSRFPELDWHRFTAVALTDSPAVKDLPRVSPDNAFAMDLALREVSRLGYTRPALHLPRAVDERTRRMHSAVFVNWLHTHQLDRGLANLDNIKSSGDFRRWIDSCTPDVIFCPHNDPYVEWWKSSALSIQSAPAFASLAWSPWFRHYAGVDKCTEKVGGHGLEMLIAALSRSETGLQTHAPTLHVPGVWRDGPSCPPAKRRKHDLAKFFRQSL